ncbi:CaiB/BaiF CoA transferase family protein [Ramlibacter sp.]|uniref:CaiB/BaiF CoA transferase family protein n=1 Tax=Ramlibacter sp. TaxID=1917967 RepID=UPI003D1269E1
MTTPSQGGALAGLKVLDLSRVLAGPLCAQMLADHGADVVKLEAPAGDETRMLGPPFDANGDAAYFGAVNRGKRDIAVDLSKPRGREVLERLIARSDVLIENFVPGTMERWGLSYEDVLAKRHPRLIYCQITGFGSDGPLGKLPGYDAVLQAMAGLMSINGTPESGPTRLGIPIVDHLTGYTAMQGILLALNARHATGRGQKVEATLFDTALSLLIPHAANFLASGREPRLLGSAHPNIAPYDKFAAADGEVFLGILTDAQFRRFCEFIGRPELPADARFLRNGARVENRDALREEIESALRRHPRDALCRELMAIGVPAGPVNTVSEALAQPHVRHREMVVERGSYKGVGPSVRLSETQASVRSGPPLFAQHTEDILREAGFDSREIESLRVDAVLAAHRGGTTT